MKDITIAEYIGIKKATQERLRRAIQEIMDDFQEKTGTSVRDIDIQIAHRQTLDKKVDSVIQKVEITHDFS